MTSCGLVLNKPHKPVTKDTIARWIKTVLGKAGIDTSSYTALVPRLHLQYHLQIFPSILS